MMRPGCSHYLFNKVRRQQQQQPRRTNHHNFEQDWRVRGWILPNCFLHGTGGGVKLMTRILKRERVLQGPMGSCRCTGLIQTLNSKP